MNIPRRRGIDFVSIKSYSKNNKTQNSKINQNLKSIHQKSKNKRYGLSFIFDPLAAIINPKDNSVSLNLSTKSESSSDFVKYVQDVNKKLKDELLNLSLESKLETTQTIDNNLNLSGGSFIKVKLTNDQSANVSNVVKLEYNTVKEKVESLASSILDKINNTINQQADLLVQEDNKNQTNQNVLDSFVNSNNESGKSNINRTSIEEFKKSLKQTFSNLKQNFSKQLNKTDFVQSLVSISNQKISNVTSHVSQNDITVDLTNKQTINSLSELILKYDITEKVLNTIKQNSSIDVHNDVFDKLKSMKTLSNEKTTTSEKVADVIKEGGAAAVNYISAWGNNFRRFVDSIGDQGSKIVSSSAEAISSILNPIIVLVIAIVIFICIVVFVYYRSKPNIGQVFSKISDKPKYTNI